MPPPAGRDDPDHDDRSCSSSVVAADSAGHGGWASEFSFGSSSSLSVSSVSTTSSSSSYSYYDHAGLTGRHKPHKAQQAHWEAIRQLSGDRGTQVGLHHFQLLRRLGGGDIGTVYLCRLRSPPRGLPECLYAMKVVDREALAARRKLVRAETEREILSILDHPFLPTLYAHFHASHYSCSLIEFCPGGDLHSAQMRRPGRRFGISSAKFYVAETLLAIEYLHMMGVIYRDLKPENVLVREDGHIMLSDFDLSLKCDVVPRLFRPRQSQTAASEEDEVATTCVGALPPVLSCFSSSSRGSESKKKQKKLSSPEEREEAKLEVVVEPANARSRSFVGTHEYLAPEVVAGSGHGAAVDWWTLGVFLYELLHGKTPFKGNTNEETIMNIIKQPLSFPRVCFKSKREEEEMGKAQDLISKLLVKSPKRRLGSCKGSVEIKRHEFFKGVNWALIRSVRPPEVPRDWEKKKMMVMSKERGLVTKKMNYVDRDSTYQISQHFDYF